MPLSIKDPEAEKLAAVRDERWARVQRLLRDEIWPEIERLHLPRTSRREKERILGYRKAGV